MDDVSKEQAISEINDTNPSPIKDAFNALVNTRNILMSLGAGALGGLTGKLKLDAQANQSLNTALAQHTEFANPEPGQTPFEVLETVNKIQDPTIYDNYIHPNEVTVVSRPKPSLFADKIKEFKKMNRGREIMKPALTGFGGSLLLGGALNFGVKQLEDHFNKEASSEILIPEPTTLDKTADEYLDVIEKALKGKDVTEQE